MIRDWAVSPVEFYSLSINSPELWQPYLLPGY